MIYTVTKNGHTSTLIIEPGDLKAKNKLSNYRQRGWQISACEGNYPANRQPKRQPNGVDNVKVKQKRLTESKKVEILKGCWIEVD